MSQLKPGVIMIDAAPKHLVKNSPFANKVTIYFQVHKASAIIKPHFGA